MDREQSFVGLATPLPIFDFEAVADAELINLEGEECRRAQMISQQMSQLRLLWQEHDKLRRQAARELLRREFSVSAFGKLDAEWVLPFIGAVEVLRLLCASPAVIAQNCGPFAKARIHHLRVINTGLPESRVPAVVRSIHWPSVQTIKADLGSPGWERLLQALGEDSPCASKVPCLGSLQGLALVFPAERSSVSLQRWQALAPCLSRLGDSLGASPLQELVLTDLRSTDLLTRILTGCGKHLRVCRASFIGPECRRTPLELPIAGLPALECLMVRHRDFCEQRKSRQVRMRVLASPLLSCFNSIRARDKFRVLALIGICIDGRRNETALLLRGLQAFKSLVAVALRFSVPSTFGSLLNLEALIRLRMAWSLIGHFTLGDTSLHGFDYWPELMTDFQQLYPHGGVPDAYAVFKNEFHHIFTSQYSTTAETQWSRMDGKQKDFWTDVGVRLPGMPLTEVC